MQRKQIKLEICVESLVSARAAAKAGAHRVELCANLAEGGITPSYGMIENVRKAINLDLHVLIRPRAGDFCYSDEELAIMLADIEAAKQLGADGVVIGVLTKGGNIAKEAAEYLMKAARPLAVTWHRAFDLAENPFRALDDIILLGCDYLLTSGQAVDAYAGRKTIKALLEEAQDNIIIMAGAGINPDNIAMIRDATGAVEFHSSARSLLPIPRIWQKGGINLGDANSKYEYTVADIAKIRAMLEKLMAK